MNIGEKIRSLRCAARMTQGELADKIGTIKQTVYKYESGKVENIPLERVVLLASALNTSPAYLLGLDAIESEEDIELTRIALERLGLRDEAEGLLDSKSILSDLKKLSAQTVGKDEERLLDLYRELNDEGKEKLIEHADDMVQSRKYIKSDPALLVERKA